MNDVLFYLFLAYVALLIVVNGTGQAAMTPQARAKAWGYEVEVAAVKALKLLWPNIARTGSVAYKASAADLAGGEPYGRGKPPFHLVVTRDKHQPLLVTLSAADLIDLARRGVGERGVLVQVKGRQRTWVGSLMRDLRKAVS